MKQITLRVPDDLAADLRDEAARLGFSVNGFVINGLRGWLDPDAEGDEVERLRAKLRRAGLLEEPEPYSGERPEPEALERARIAAGRGTPLSDLVSEGRGPR